MFNVGWEQDLEGLAVARHDYKEADKCKDRDKCIKLLSRRALALTVTVQLVESCETKMQPKAEKSEIHISLENKQ